MKNHFPEFKKPKAFIRTIMTLLGLILTGIGILGIILPILPGYPFLLLAGVLFFNSSESLYNWLHTNKLTGPTMRRFSKDGGMTKKEKRYLLITSWLIMIPAIILTFGSIFFLILIIIITIFNSLFIIIFVKTTDKYL